MTPDLIVAASTPNLQAVSREGFVSNLAHPGGNITGFTAYERSMGGKWIDLLKQMVPTLARIVVMFDSPAPLYKVLLPAIEAASQILKMQVIAAPVHDEAQIQRVIDDLSHEPNSGLLLPPDTFIAEHNDLIIALVARRGLPTMYATELAVRKGGLMFYGVDFEPEYRQAAVYANSILKGTAPGDLPIQLPINFKLIVNLKTARALGIEAPMGLMLRADELIE
jgi:putative ABC transport system substrate-binding protein